MPIGMADLCFAVVAATRPVAARHVFASLESRAIELRARQYVVPVWRVAG